MKIEGAQRPVLDATECFTEPRGIFGSSLHILDEYMQQCGYIFLTSVRLLSEEFKSEKCILTVIKASLIVQSRLKVWIV